MSNLFALAVLTFSLLSLPARAATGKIVNIHYSDATCENLIPSVRGIRAKKSNIKAIVRAFFSTSTLEVSEKKKGAFRLPEQAFGKLYLGHHEEKGGTIILQFKPGAERYLGGTACDQNVNRAPLEKMLKAIPGVSEIRFEVAGKNIDLDDA